MQTKEELVIDIGKEIGKTKQSIDNTWSDYKTDAMNRIALSNLYIALSNLTK